VLQHRDSIIGIVREISVTEMVKIFCGSCSFREQFFFLWIAHLTAVCQEEEEDEDEEDASALYTLY
jgi:hypothetical protein